MKKYPVYKDSGVEWLGKVPEEWQLLRIGNFVMSNEIQIQNGFAYGGFNKNDEGIPHLRPFNVTPDGKFYLDDIKYIDVNKEEVSRYLLQFSDILFNNTNSPSQVGKCAIWKLSGDYSCSNHMTIIQVRNRERICPEFLNFFLKKFFNDLLFQAICIKYINQANIGDDQIRNLPIAVPIPKEQQSIATYLDHKTNLIDNFINKKKKQIELFKKQKTAIINHAVTKGLNPNVKMKDSGVEWIGEVPEGWDSIKLKFLSDIKYGLGQPPRQLDNGLPIIRATNIERGKINPHNLMFIDPNDVPYDRDPVLKENDIIVVRSGAYTGDSAIIPKKYEGSITGYDMVVRVHNAIPQFIGYCLLSHYVLKNQIDLCRLRAAQPHLNAEELGETIIIQPPINTQEKIVEYIDMKMEKMEKSIFIIQNQIKLLQEYRTTLISEAVTGKIDVRDEKVPTS
jgi:type I restriction enzyme, S subunit